MLVTSSGYGATIVICRSNFGEVELDKVAVGFNRLNRESVVVVILSAIIFGIYPSTAKMAFAGGVNVVTVIIFTTFSRALLLATVAKLKRRSIVPKQGESWAIVSAAFFQLLSIIGVLGSLQYLAAPVTITIVFTHTMMLFLFLVFKGETRMSVATFILTLLALVGVSLVVDLWGNKGSASYIGLLLATIAAVASAVRVYIFGKQLEKGDSAVVGAQVMITAFAMTLLLCFYQVPSLPASLSGYLWLLSSGLTMAVATYGMFYGISLLGAFQFSLFMKIEPIFTTLFSILILGEILKPQQYCGILLVICSLVAYQLNMIRKKN